MESAVRASGESPEQQYGVPKEVPGQTALRPQRDHSKTTFARPIQYQYTPFFMICGWPEGPCGTALKITLEGAAGSMSGVCQQSPATARFSIASVDFHPLLVAQQGRAGLIGNLIFVNIGTR